MVTVLGGIAPAGWPFMSLALFLLEWYSRCVKSACHSTGHPGSCYKEADTDFRSTTEGFDCIWNFSNSTES